MTQKQRTEPAVLRAVLLVLHGACGTVDEVLTATYGPEDHASSYFAEKRDQVKRCGPVRWALDLDETRLGNLIEYACRCDDVEAEKHVASIPRCSACSKLLTIRDERYSTVDGKCFDCARDEDRLPEVTP